MAMKKRRRSEGIIAVDRLSDLPDEVLGNILSFLPTRKAVQTSVLSRRWQGVFSLATNLDFDYSYSYEAEGFINFVDTVLLLHKVSINRFKLIVSSSDMKDASCVNAWIASALSLGAQELDLDLSCGMDDITQHKLLSSCMMTVLILKCGFYVDTILKVPTCVCLCSLRVLNLERIIFPDVDSTSRFFIGCSSLTDLTLSGCEWMDGGVYKLSFPKLRNLTIDDLNPLRCSTKPIIELDLPHVVYFKCGSCPWNLFRIKNPVVICTAELDFPCLSGGEGAKLHSLTRLMKQLSDVKVLRLLGESLTVINRIKLSKLPTIFVNLSRLEVETRYGERRKGWKRLPKLIARAPMLETLVFKGGLETCYNDLVAFLEVQRKPITKNHLTIVVERYRGEKREYRMLKLFLKSVAFNVKQLIVKRAGY